MKDLLNTIALAIAGFGEKLSPPLYDTTHSRGRTKYTAVRDGYKLTSFDPRNHKKNHRLDTLEAVLAYLGRHGKPAETTVFVDKKAVVSLLGDVDNGLDLDTVTCPLAESVELRAWKAIVGHRLPHKQFKNAVDDRADDLTEASRVLALGLGSISARHSVQVNHDNSNGDTTSFAVTDGVKIGKVDLPNRFDISIPLFLAWPEKYKLSLRLEHQIDASDKDKKPVVFFSVAFRDLEDAIDLAVRDMAEHLAEKLGEDWLVVTGAPNVAAV